MNSIVSSEHIMKQFLRNLILLSVSLPIALVIGCSTSERTIGVAGHSTEQPTAGPLPIPSDQFEELPNPLYQDWASFPVGTTVVIKDTHQHGNNRTVSTKVLKLAELTPDLAVVEEQITTVYPDGRKEENPPMRHEHVRTALVLKGTDPKSIGRGGKPIEEGEETLNTPIGDVQARWFTFKGRVEAGEILHKVWTSAKVPGGMVRVESRVPALSSLTVVEVTEVQRPPAKDSSSP